MSVPERVRVAGRPREVAYPARPPEELLECAEFLETMNLRMRELRDSGSLPRSALTLPDELDQVHTWSLAELRRQALAALEAGEPLVSVRIPLTDEVVALARWSEERMDLLTALTRAGMVQSPSPWQRSLDLIIEMFQTVVAHLPPRA